MQKEKLIGIYKITCISNNKIYIGSSLDIKDRWLHHLSDLRNNKHHSIYLQRSFNKYGESSLKFEVLLQLYNYNEELLRMIEWYYIEELKPEFNSTAPCIYESTIEWRTKIAESTKRLYENGYINPRKGIGKRYNVYNEYGDLIHINMTLSEIAILFKASTGTYNTMLRKYSGICCSKTNNCIIIESSKSIEDVIIAYKTTNFNNKCPVYDLDGNSYTRRTYYYKSKPHKGKSIFYADIYKLIMQSPNLYVTINNKIFTLPFLCRFVQQCISNNT